MAPPMSTNAAPASLSPWDRVLLARHANRPHTLAYIGRLCDEFVELHGDRSAAEDAAMVGGIGHSISPATR